MAHIREAGTAAHIVPSAAAEASLAGYCMLRRAGRPQITLKLAISLDGCIALADGSSQWITGEAARAHVHLERARADAIIVGGQTLRADRPRLDVRLPGLAQRSPQRWVLTAGKPPEGWLALPSPQAVSAMSGIQYLFLEGGAGAASAFLKQDLVDRLLLYRAPILIGAGRPAMGDIGLAGLDEAHGRWRLADRRSLGSDILEVYERARCLPE